MLKTEDGMIKRPISKLRLILPSDSVLDILFLKCMTQYDVSVHFNDFFCFCFRYCVTISFGWKVLNFLVNSIISSNYLSVLYPA